MLKTVRAVDYAGEYVWARGSKPATVNMAHVVSAVLIPPQQTRNIYDDITRLNFADGSHLDVFGKPEDFTD